MSKILLASLVLLSFVSNSSHAQQRPGLGVLPDPFYSGEVVAKNPGSVLLIRIEGQVAEQILQRLLKRRNVQIVGKVRDGDDGRVSTETFQCNRTDENTTCLIPLSNDGKIDPDASSYNMPF